MGIGCSSIEEQSGTVNGFRTGITEANITALSLLNIIDNFECYIEQNGEESFDYMQDTQPR
jgi:hypothetical protein